MKLTKGVPNSAYIVFETDENTAYPRCSYRAYDENGDVVVTDPSDLNSIQALAYHALHVMMDILAETGVTAVPAEEIDDTATRH